MSVSDLKRWEPAARDFHPLKNPLNVPLDVALREAIRAAVFFKKCWKPKKEIPGLSSLPELSLSMADDLISIVRAVQEAQLDMFLEEEEGHPLPPELDIWEEARAVRAELDAALTYLLQVGPLESEDAQRIKKIKAHWAKESQKEEYSLKIFLKVFAETAERVRPALSQLSDSFDVACIDRAQALVSELNQDLMDQTVVRDRQWQSRQLFYQLLALMQDRVQEIRKAAAFVFRKYPRILQKFTSEYERKRRAASRKEKKNAAPQKTKKKQA